MQHTLTECEVFAEECCILIVHVESFPSSHYAGEKRREKWSVIAFFCKIISLLLFLSNKYRVGSCAVKVILARSFAMFQNYINRSRNIVVNIDVIPESPKSKIRKATPFTPQKYTYVRQRARSIGSIN